MLEGFIELKGWLAVPSYQTGSSMEATRRQVWKSIFHEGPWRDNGCNPFVGPFQTQQEAEQEAARLSEEDAMT